MNHLGVYALTTSNCVPLFRPIHLDPTHGEVHPRQNRNHNLLEVNTASSWPYVDEIHWRVEEFATL